MSRIAIIEWAFPESTCPPELLKTSKTIDIDLILTEELNIWCNSGLYQAQFSRIMKFAY